MIYSSKNDFNLYLINSSWQYNHICNISKISVLYRGRIKKFSQLYNVSALNYWCNASFMQFHKKHEFLAFERLS